MALAIDDVDRNEGRLLLMSVFRSTILLATMLFQPEMNRVDGATGVTGDLGDGAAGFENKGDGTLTHLLGIADTRH